MDFRVHKGWVASVRLISQHLALHVEIQGKKHLSNVMYIIIQLLSANRMKIINCHAPLQNNHY